MTSRDISNSDDIIDSRDVIARIDELESMMEDAKGDWDGSSELDKPKAIAEFEEEYWHELESLRKLRDDADHSPDWKYGESLIRDSYFKDYAIDLADDIGAIPKDAGWPSRCIDWDQAASELQMDYSSVEFDGVTYWIRS